MSEFNGIDDRLREIQGLLLGAGASPAPEAVAPAPAELPEPPALPPPVAAPPPPAYAPAPPAYAPAPPAYAPAPPVYAPAQFEPPTAPPAAAPPAYPPPSGYATQSPPPEYPAPSGYPAPQAYAAPAIPAVPAARMPPAMPVHAPAPVPAGRAPAAPPPSRATAIPGLAERAATIAPGVVYGSPTQPHLVAARDGLRQTQDLAERAVIEPAEARARTIVAAAEREASRIVNDARSEVDELTRQIDELVALRARIINSMPGMPGGPPAPEMAPSGPLASAPLEPAPALAPPSPPPSVAPATQVPAAMSTWLDHGRFGSASGIVVLTIGPFADIVSIERFERALMVIDALDEVYLRAYESGRCIFELTMGRSIPLVAEIERVSSARITIDSETATALAATFVALASGGQP